ncbi:hypothetical protein FNH22_18930 [Fulvivirga sp. M361]|uniref:S41 family peptidase n=1 Tax=Fulvivirga sp. M361 TaxID=2594266 RepID=UPI00117A55B4|nr:S41 family peptidase [Fulvivirga sp. M361]TRX54830.1 hypothetical protein FNH22_18930 [Fulvivirga sp. M361]
MKYLNILLQPLVLIMFVSCHQEDPAPTGTTVDFEQLFESFWRQMNKNYVYWDIDSTDWDGIYPQYKGIFSQLNLNDENDVRSSVRYYREMTKYLVDGHCRISFSHPAIVDSVIDPLLERKNNLGVLNEPYSYFLRDTVYLDTGYFVGHDAQNTLNNQPLTIICGEINGDILYFSCNFFKLSKSYYSNTGENIKATLDFFFNWVENNLESSKGIIIDVRNNPGGNLEDLNFLLGKLVDQPLHIGYCQYKNGDSCYDLTPRIKAYVNPGASTKNVQLPIVVLADNYSASLSEVITNAIMAFSQGIFIGETTFGATSPVIPFKVYASGSFEIENFMSVQLSSCKFISLNGNVYESSGLAPDIFIPHSSEAYDQGRDAQLEYAIELLK